MPGGSCKAGVSTRTRSPINKMDLAVGSDGWAVWNVSDASSHRYELRVREPSGTIRSLNAAKSREPLEIGLDPYATV